MVTLLNTIKGIGTQFDSIQTLIDQWTKGVTTSEGLDRLLGDFSGFYEKVFRYVNDAFPGHVEIKGEDLAIRLLARNLNLVMERVQLEWAAMSVATTQRRVPVYRRALERADSFARAYYEKYRGYKPVESGTPAAYFEKLYDITRYVFSPNPLIAIPLRYFTLESRWQALAHEIGHYIYWNSAPLWQYEHLHNQLSDLLTDVIRGAQELSTEAQQTLAQRWIGWQEEVFADICGTLLAGPGYIDFWMERQNEVQSTADELLADDGEHPIEYIRPLIGLVVLKWIAKQPEHAAKKAGLEAVIHSLQSEWDTKFESVVANRPTYDVEAGAAPAPDLVVRFVEPIVEAMLSGHKSGVWAGKDYTEDGRLESDGIGYLIDYRWWLDRLSSWQPGSAFPAILAPGETLPALPPVTQIKAQVEAQLEALFRGLIRHLVTQLKIQNPRLDLDEKTPSQAVIERLLAANLSITREQGGSCKQRWVDPAGTDACGNQLYVSGSTCYRWTKPFGNQFRGCSASC